MLQITMNDGTIINGLANFAGRDKMGTIEILDKNDALEYFEGYLMEKVGIINQDLLEMIFDNTKNWIDKFIDKTAY